MPHPPMNPDSMASRCLAVLKDGPATTGEVAAELGVRSKLAGTHLAQLMRRKKVTRKPFMKAVGERGQRQCFLWSAAA